LRATAEISGPVAGPDVATGMELQDKIDAFDKGKREGEFIISTDDVNYEDLNLGELPAEEILTDVVPGETAEERKQRRAEERRKVLEARHKKEMHNRKQKEKVQSEGEPFLKTIKAPADGWYRFCLRAAYNQVTAEIDLRKESELGGLDENGHVLTFGQKVMLEDEKMMEVDTAAEEGITDEDFKAARDKLKTLRRLLADIQAKQNQERHRLAVHSQTNEHSHSRMALNSLLETILFMLVTGYQVYTLRKWFKGAPVLGR